VPQEHEEKKTQSLLAAMLTRPPNALVIQTRNPLIRRDLDIIKELSTGCELWVSITVETDMERIPGLPPHATSPAKRIDTLRLFRNAGVKTQATVSPLLPIENPELFAHRLDEACDRVIVDHYEIGDGSPGGFRTKRTQFPSLLEQAGYREWNKLEKLWEIRDIFAAVLGPERVLVSKEGFNAVG
jgi:DNA repair photolyase